MEYFLSGVCCCLCSLALPSVADCATYFGSVTFERLLELSDALPQPFKHFLTARRYQACLFWVCPVMTVETKRNEYLKIAITCRAHHNGDIKRGSCKWKIATALKIITLTV